MMDSHAHIAGTQLVRADKSWFPESASRTAWIDYDVRPPEFIPAWHSVSSTSSDYDWIHCVRPSSGDCGWCSTAEGHPADWIDYMTDHATSSWRCDRVYSTTTQRS